MYGSRIHACMHRGGRGELWVSGVWMSYQGSSWSKFFFGNIVRLLIIEVNKCSCYHILLGTVDFFILDTLPKKVCTNEKEAALTRQCAAVTWHLRKLWTCLYVYTTLANFSYKARVSCVGFPSFADWQQQIHFLVHGLRQVPLKYLFISHSSSPEFKFHYCPNGLGPSEYQSAKQATNPVTLD